MLLAALRQMTSAAPASRRSSVQTFTVAPVVTMSSIRIILLPAILSGDTAGT